MIEPLNTVESERRLDETLNERRVLNAALSRLGPKRIKSLVNLLLSKSTFINQ